MSEELPAGAPQETKATKEAKETRTAQEAAGPLHAEEAEEARAAGTAKASGRAKAPRGAKKSATDRAAKGAKGKGEGVEPVAPLDWSNPLRDPQDRRLPRIAGPSGLVIFGVTGDLSRRKLMPAVYDLANRGLLPPGFSLVGFARRDWEDQDFAQVVHDAVKEHARTPFREEVWQQLSEGMRFIPGDFDDDNAFEQLRKAVEELDASRGTSGNYAFYLSVPPKFFPKVVQQLKKHGLTDAPDGSWRRAVIEKPFGHDLDSARDLNALVHEVFDPEQVFRIDHYLGKETVQNILALRFANQMYEPIWNRSYVDHVQITMAEDIGIGGRAGYYDGIGAARDVIQNHLLQLMALTAMEEPAAFDARSLLTEKLKVLRAVRLPDDLGEHTVRGQYAGGWQGGAQVPGYLEEEGIDPASTTDTYAAIKLGIDNRRWAGVPFYLRTGKRLGRRVTEIAVVFQRAPHSPFDSTATEELGENAIVIRVQPDEGMTVRFGSKVPGTSMEIRDVSMDFAYGESFTESSPEAYERLILDVLLGDANLFPRHQEVEESWRILDPIEEYWASHDKPAQYASGGWGPREADEMLARDGRSWRRP
ncbi:glucose-6-phosphate dehydrogenase [Streptomyces sp. NPDC005395]|uniref:glucose-6-phosphate dehydrogenase n=1 Tax=Streptomyces TaxID=1883 RepID=UPI000F6F4B93|nr:MULTISPECIES: glucose-6-phosphate dehydrogenase [Streptomyces]AZM74382.1 glucose-6-phosphate dehydrogenase [Streptomyces sp. KPB2]NDZ71063.1 glucose-6-phosphate dehydrogenase [Streptomyces sp. SID10362]QKW59877.1 glucose-6-phosphate dehydrogenase [Streptomyces sp. NA03103]WSU00081.1 glucose-6-phosphate dehydrogenase [Streptomyces sp. NBC_01124]